MVAAANRSHPALLRAGRIAGIHALKGAVRVRLDNPGSDALERVSRVFVEQCRPESGRGTAREFKLKGVTRLNAATVRVALEGVADAAGAESLKGAVLMVAAEDLPALKPGEFYYQQAQGCEVWLAGGARIGTIEGTFFNGAHEVWIVQMGRREVLVPVIGDVVKAMDFAARRVTIEALPGLLD